MGLVISDHENTTKPPISPSFKPLLIINSWLSTLNETILSELLFEISIVEIELAFLQVLMADQIQ